METDSVKAIKVHKAMCEVSRTYTSRFKISNSVLVFLDTIVSLPTREPSVNMTSGGDIRITLANHPEQQDWKYFIGTTMRESQVEILRALSKSVADLDAKQIKEFLQQFRGEDKYSTVFIDYKRTRRFPYYMHLVFMMADNGRENATHNPLLVSIAEVTETFQKLTTEQQSDVEETVASLCEFKATRYCGMMEDLRLKLFAPKLWSVLPDSQKKQASERWSFNKNKRLLELIEEKLNTVKVNRKTPAQEMEYSFVKTQVYAIIWGRLDKRRIIRIEGAAMNIKFKEDTKPIRVKAMNIKFKEDTKPICVKPRHLAPLESANLRCRMQKMLSKSKSEWSQGSI
jgi:hypothetical protein